MDGEKHTIENLPEVEDCSPCSGNGCPTAALSVVGVVGDDCEIDGETWSVYVLRHAGCVPFYCGITTDINARGNAHRDRYWHKERPLEVVEVACNLPRIVAETFEAAIIAQLVALGYEVANKNLGGNACRSFSRYYGNWDLLRYEFATDETIRLNATLPLPGGYGLDPSRRKRRARPFSHPEPTR